VELFEIDFDSWNIIILSIFCFLCAQL